MPGKQNFVSGSFLREQITKFYAKPVTRVSVELVLSILTVIGFALFAIRPTLNTMSQLVKEIDDKKKLDTALTKKIAALSTAQSEYITYKDRFAILDTAYRRDFTLSEVLFYVEYLVSHSAPVTFNSLIIDEYPVEFGALATASAQIQPAAVLSGAVVSHPVKITLSGKFVDLLQVLASLEKIRPLMSVGGFAFQLKDSNNTGSGQAALPTADQNLSLSIVLNVYSFGQSAAKATTTTTQGAVKAPVRASEDITNQ